MDIFCFLEKYLLVAVGEDASPSVDVVMGLVLSWSGSQVAPHCDGERVPKLE